MRLLSSLNSYFVCLLSLLDDAYTSAAVLSMMNHLLDQFSTWRTAGSPHSVHPGSHRSWRIVGRGIEPNQSSVTRLPEVTSYPPRPSRARSAATSRPAAAERKGSAASGPRSCAGPTSGTAAHAGGGAAVSGKRQARQRSRPGRWRWSWVHQVELVVAWIISGGRDACTSQHGEQSPPALLCHQQRREQQRDQVRLHPQAQRHCGSQESGT
jgi:hypothetical protein